MKIRHFLKDGTEVENVAGRIIPLDDFTGLYRIIDGINNKGGINEAIQTPKASVKRS